MFFEQMHPRWQSYLADQQDLLNRIERQVRAASDLVPALDLVMRAFSTDPNEIRVVLLGQDPYPNPGDAIGLAFAITEDRKKPQSLKNIFRELEDDIGLQVSEEANLLRWVNQGVLLLNTSLTSLAHQPEAHSGIGWEEFTFAAMNRLSREQKIVILAWGNHARSLAKKLPEAAAIESAHPSPLSANRGFFGSKPFSRANLALIELGLEPIDWAL